MNHEMEFKKHYMQANREYYAFFVFTGAASMPSAVMAQNFVLQNYMQ